MTASTGNSTPEGPAPGLLGFGGLLGFENAGCRQLLHGELGVEAARGQE